MELVNEGNIDELIKAQNHIWNHTCYFIKSISLKCAVQLGIPDIIHNHGQPMTLSELAVALQVHPAKTNHLYRLMRVLVHSGFFHLLKNSENNQESYMLAPASCLLLKDSPLNTTPFISLIHDPVLREPYNFLTPFLRNDDPTLIVTSCGETLWDRAGHDARFNNLFNDAMASDSSVIGRAVIIKCKKVFEGLNSLVDVGGGTGTMAKTIAEAFPKLNCRVLDLPHVVADLKGSNNISFVGGDMFQKVPPADAILLKWILHDWPDEECVKILKNCKEAIPSRKGKIIIIEMVMGNQTWDDHSCTEAQILFDMEMMATVTGRERNEKEWAKLFFDAGFSSYKIQPVLGPRAVIEIYA